MQNVIGEQAIEIMELVTEITAAAVSVPLETPTIATTDKLVRTLFSTMCELIEKVS
jgi:hypothetical protein